MTMKFLTFVLQKFYDRSIWNGKFVYSISIQVRNSIKKRNYQSEFNAAREIIQEIKRQNWNQLKKNINKNINKKENSCSYTRHIVTRAGIYRSILKLIIHRSSKHPRSFLESVMEKFLSYGGCGVTCGGGSRYENFYLRGPGNKDDNRIFYKWRGSSPALAFITYSISGSCRDELAE